MPLRWNVTKCADPAKLTSKREWGITNTLIMLMPVIGMSDITESNAFEVYARLKMTERSVGGLMNGALRTPSGRIKRKNGEPVIGTIELTAEMVHARIGLTTNAVGRDEPRGKWLMRMGKRDLDELGSAYKRAVCEHDWRDFDFSGGNTARECRKCGAYERVSKEA
jgi:hypothetical protein